MPTLPPLNRSRDPLATTAATATAAIRGDRTYTVFAGCDYLGLAHEPELADAAADAFRRLGMSTSASRRTSGNTALHERLEQRLAAFFSPVLPGCRAILTLDGLTANMVALHALSDAYREAVIDERAHASIGVAARAAGLPISTFASGDTSAAISAAEASTPAIVATDGVFATTGRPAPASDLLQRLPRDACLLLDDCHGVGVLGVGGRGSLSAVDADDGRVVLTTTLAKGIGCAGGVVVGPPELITRARSVSPAYVGTTPTSPGLVAAAIAALDMIDSQPQRLLKLRQNAARLHATLRAAGLTLAGPPGDGIPIAAFVADDATTERIVDALDRAAMLLPLIDYPGGPAPRYFRASVNCMHTPEQIDDLGRVLRDAVGMT